MGRSKAHKQKREESAFGERLKAIRKSKGLTLMGLAELVGIKHQQLSNLGRLSRRGRRCCVSPRRSRL
jgi:hypothetical protein